MVQKLYRILACSFIILALSACVKEMNIPVPPAKDDGNNSIILDIGKDVVPATRAEAGGAEMLVEHLDVLIFEDNGDFRWHERAVLSDGNGSGKIVLGAVRDSFAANERYWVYLVANSTYASSSFEGISLNDLRSMTEETLLIFLTGGSSQYAPKTFLMDGVAYPASVSNVPAPSPVVLYDGVLSNDTELKVELRRAAAKIVVNINKGDQVKFAASSESGYYISNMPYSTSVISGINAPAALRTPQRYGGSDFFKWTEESITVTGYTYAHEWSDASAFENEVRLVVNIPMNYDGTEYADSYYQIPVSKDKVLERNTYYEVNVTVNAPGAIDPSDPAELKPISYKVLDWTEKTIDIGGNDDRPAYLALNRYELEMDNVEDDNTSISFASSSDVTIKVDAVYYFDKFGQQKNVANNGVSVSPVGDLNGTLAIHSPIPTNNTVRYIKFTVSNKDGLSKQVTVMQYPLEYITNILGWYSYREDFGGTTYERPGNDRIVSAIIKDSWWSGWNGWEYSNSRNSSGAFFRSKVVTNTVTSGANAGKSDLAYYYWTEGGSKGTSSYLSARDGGNARMYHVRITATSGDYVIGRPRITDGKTDPGEDNAKLVSPSFMIASQLGAVQPTEYLDAAADHCGQYVEVAQNGTVYSDWRLPTEAELTIIMQYQNASDAMDEVLAAKWYWSASGAVENPDPSNFNGTETNAYIRCIRDAYE